MTENERSIQKRPELVPERLMRGGLIVGMEQGIQGSLMSVTGAAIERITRERTEVPPQFKLPERAVYFLDPNTRRLIMISNRENRGENKTPDKYGLFAEIVELDEEGKPHYRLSTSEIILPNDNYQLVAVGPNSYGLPPSHIEVVEEEEGKKKFVPWNLWLGTLQSWMNEVKIDSNTDFETFIKRFLELRKGGMHEAEERIRQYFSVDSLQGIAEGTAPVNIIIDDKGLDSALIKASLDVGFYPGHIGAKDIAETYRKQGGWEDVEILRTQEGVIRQFFSIDRYLPDEFLTYNLQPAVLTLDIDDANKFREENGFKPLYIAREFQKHNSIFSLVTVIDTRGIDAGDTGEVRKRQHGYYSVPYDEEMYRGLLNKLKADLLLTMFLRGGSPLTK